MEKKKNNPIAKELRSPKYKSQVIPNKKKTYFEDFHDKMVEEKELLKISMKESKKQKDERTPSEKLQDELEPIITAPMMEME
tara:strand:+ start:94 stop:339 length:246 start_codon:yes stop_codon:yes gene_type:complete